MNYHDRREIGVLGIIAGGARNEDTETIHNQLQHEFGLRTDFSYMKCASILLRLDDGGYIERDSYTGSSDTASEDAPTDPYRLTQKGQTRLRSLLRLPIEKVADPAQQPHLLMKIRFLHHLPENEQLEELTQLEDHIIQVRNELIDHENKRQPGSQVDSEYQQAASDILILTFDEYLNTIDDLRTSISLGKSSV